MEECEAVEILNLFTCCLACGWIVYFCVVFSAYIGFILILQEFFVASLKYEVMGVRDRGVGKSFKVGTMYSLLQFFAIFLHYFPRRVHIMCFHR